MGAITEDVFIFFCRDCTLEQDLKDCWIKILFLFFFSTTIRCKWFDNSSLVFFSFLFSLNCQCYVELCSISMSTRKHNGKIYHSSSCISIRRISELEWTTRGSPFGIGSLERKYIARRAVPIECIIHPPQDIIPSKSVYYHSCTLQCRKANYQSLKEFFEVWEV